MPKGGPDGGDGGKGGDVVVSGSKDLLSLLDFKYKRIYRAEKGRIGGGQNKTGRNGRNLSLRVPVGTEVYDRSTGELLVDITEDGQTFIVARGGSGGRGNARFVSSVHQAPREFEEGGEGEERDLYLKLKLLADIGIIGLPNAGKSTLLGRLTGAKPETGDYAFTTLIPSLGVLSRDDVRLVLADIPGIIDGASTGKGLGLSFLKHIERTRMLLWLLDGSSPSVGADYETLRRELGLYNDGLLRRKRIVVVNKTDLVSEADLALARATLESRGEQVIAVSALMGRGIEDLARALAEEGGLARNG